MYKEIEKKCLSCGKIFKTTKPRQKYCSRECYLQLFERKNKICEVCGKEYSVPPSKAKYSKYCSLKCSAKAKSLAKPKTHIGICKLCGKKFRYKTKRKFCSDECEKIATKVRYPNGGVDETEKSCPMCGETFVGQLLLCDAVCHEKAYHENKELYDLNFEKILYYLEKLQGANPDSI